MSYSAHSDFVAPAKTHPALWRLVVGLIVAAAIYLGAIIGIVALVNLLASPEQSTRWLAQMQAGQGPIGALLMLSTFPAMALGAVAAAALLHRRGPLTLFGPWQIAIEHFKTGFSTAMIIILVVTGLFALIVPLDPGMGTRPWVALLPVVVIALFVQTGAEELLFRGYIQQQLAARFSNPWVWMVLPSVLFGALHFDPSNIGPAALLMVAAATMFGLFAADLTARTGTIGAAWGFHLANNAAAFLLVSLPDNLGGLSLYTTRFGMADTAFVIPAILLDIATTVGIWFAIRWALGRKETITE